MNSVNRSSINQPPTASHNLGATGGNENPTQGYLTGRDVIYTAILDASLIHTEAAKAMLNCKYYSNDIYKAISIFKSEHNNSDEFSSIDLVRIIERDNFTDKPQPEISNNHQIIQIPRENSTAAQWPYNQRQAYNHASHITDPNVTTATASQLATNEIPPTKTIDKKKSHGDSNKKKAQYKKLSDLLKENEKMKDSITCTICLDKPRNVVFKTCLHAASCYNCSTELRSCPICREVITESVKFTN